MKKLLKSFFKCFHIVERLAICKQWIYMGESLEYFERGIEGIEEIEKNNHQGRPRICSNQSNTWTLQTL